MFNTEKIKKDITYF